MHCEMHFCISQERRNIYDTNHNLNLGTEKYHVNLMETSSSNVTVVDVAT